jgi:hypothetical protein
VEPAATRSDSPAPWHVITLRETPAGPQRSQTHQATPVDHAEVNGIAVSPAARVEISDRLLAENLKRAEAQGEAPSATADEEEGDDE